MPVRELAGKTLGFGLTALALIAGGILVLLGPHAYNDYFNIPIGIILILIGLAAGGIGVSVILGVIVDARARERESRLQVTPRSGPPAPPPAWGMGDIGRPGAGNVAHVSEVRRGGGGVRVMHVALRSWDGPLFIGFLVAWTVVTLIFFAPK